MNTRITSKINLLSYFIPRALIPYIIYDTDTPPDLSLSKISKAYFIFLISGSIRLGGLINFDRY